MGWWGYGIFQGDGPLDELSVLLSFFVPKKDKDLVSEIEPIILGRARATKAQKEMIEKNLSQGILKMQELFKKKKEGSEDKALVAQAFLALAMNCKIKVDPLVIGQCLEVFENLYGNGDDIYSPIESFNEPKERRKNLNAFKRKAQNYMQKMIEDFYPNQVKAIKIL